MRLEDSAYNALSVEDDFHARQCLVDLIEAHDDFKVTHAVGVYRFDQEPLSTQPDIALIDIGLPDDNGKGLINHIFDDS